jgi:cytochrome c oxidase assembly factor CtaG
LFNAALANESLHIFQHLTFLCSGVIFWWPIVGPIEEAHPSIIGSTLYLFTACLSCSLLGAILTFNPPGLYPAYLHPADSLSILGLVRYVWGLDPAKDQQLGGLVMWVPGCFVYLSAILWILARWYRAPDPDGQETVWGGQSWPQPAFPPALGASTEAAEKAPATATSG